MLMVINITWNYPGTTKNSHISKGWKFSDKLREQRSDLLKRIMQYQMSCRSKGNKVPNCGCVWYNNPRQGVMVLNFAATKLTKELQWTAPRPGDKF